MNKAQLAETVAVQHGLTKTQAADILGTVFATITDKVAAGEDVTLFGFGAFKKHHKPARVMRNPQTGDPIDVEAKDVPRFSPAGAFEAAVKSGGRTVAAA